MSIKNVKNVNLGNFSKKELMILSNRIDFEIERWQTGERRRQDVLMAASEFFEVPIRDIKGSLRNRRIADVRKVIAKVLRKENNTFEIIAHSLDAHHTSVIYMVDAADSLIKVQRDDNFTDMYKGFLNFLTNDYDPTGEAASFEAQN